MNSRALRRLATDHGALHSQPLPPNYLFVPGSSTDDDLTELDILLAGPTHTPFVAGVWKLHLTIPANYPQQPPTANFRTNIFHPNVDPQTGGVCVETLKRDWDSKLTLRDVLVTISCLLIQPNPDSALNAEAGALIQENYDAFARRAKLMTSIHATIPKTLQIAVKEAQCRGQDGMEDEDVERRPKESNDLSHLPEAPVRRRGPTARQRGTTASRRSDGSPTGGPARLRHHTVASQPFVVQTGNDDVFGMSRFTRQEQTISPQQDDDSSMMDADQENDESRSPVKATAPKALSTPRRPLGAPIPLGELALDEVVSSDSSDEEEIEAEYPPSPRKSPSKSPVKRQLQFNNIDQQPESSRAAAQRGAPNITPPNDPDIKRLAENSPFVMFADATATPSPRKNRPQQTPGSGLSKKAPLFPSLATPQGIFKPKSPSSSEKKRREARRLGELDARLWELCGGDIKRWNQGDFDGEPFVKKARRW